MVVLPAPVSSASWKDFEIKAAPIKEPRFLSGFWPEIPDLLGQETWDTS